MEIGYLCDLWAEVHFRAVGAGFKAFGGGALAYFAHLDAVNGLAAVHTTSFAVDMFRTDIGIVILGPYSSCFLAQCLIIFFCSHVGIALLAIDTTNSD